MERMQAEDVVEELCPRPLNRVALERLADWIINHDEQIVEVFRDARDGEWGSRRAFGRGESIRMLALPDLAIAVGEMLPPPEG